jgi:polyphosphate kinase
MQIHEYNVKTTEAMAHDYYGFMFRGFKYFARFPLVITKDGFKLRGFKHLTPVNYPRVN